MARFYADEQFPFPVVECLRDLGHDVLTVREAGKANQGISDPEVLEFAIADDRVILTWNRQDFVRLHRLDSNHPGIVVCSKDLNWRTHQNSSVTEQSTFEPLGKVNKSLLIAIICNKMPKKPA